MTSLLALLAYGTLARAAFGDRMLVTATAIALATQGLSSVLLGFAIAATRGASADVHSIRVSEVLLEQGGLVGARGLQRSRGGGATSFSSFLRHPLSVLLVNICDHSNNCIKRVVDLVSLGKPVLNEGGQVFPVPDQLIVVAEARATSVLFEQRGVVLDHLGPLPQLFEHRERVAGLVDRFKPYAEYGDKCRVVGKWRHEGFYSLDDAYHPVDSISFQE